MIIISFIKILFIVNTSYSDKIEALLKDKSVLENELEQRNV